MKLIPISIACPECGSLEVIYSCNPACCFNHVCNNCYATFELETDCVGELAEPFDTLADPDSTNPTAPCARCGEYRIFAISNGRASPPQYLCVSCRALLTVSFAGAGKG